MKVLVGVVVAAAVVAAIWYFGMSYTIDVGISPSAPLGDFTKMNESGGDAREYLLATFDRGGAQGQWRKDGGSATLTIPQEITDIVTFAVK